MGSVGKKIKKVVKKVMRPKVLLPLAAIAIGGPALMGGLKGAAIGAGAAPGSLMASGMAKSALASKATIGSALKSGIGALVKKAAMSPITQGIMTGLKNPLSLKGAATYGGLAALGMGLLGDKEQPMQGSGPQGATAQNMYNSFLMSGRKAGYSDDEINTIYAPYGDMYAGDYTPVRSDPREREIQFPGTNYPLYVANGGRIGMNTGGSLYDTVVKGGPHKEEDIGIGYELMETYNIRNKAIMEAKRRAEREAERRMKEIYQDYIDRHEQMLEGPLGDQVPPASTFEEMFPYAGGRRSGEIFPSAGGRRSPGANEDAIAEQMYNIQMQEMMNPRAPRAGGGIMQVAPGVPAGMELDYRNTGGFIPMGGPERADDVPAMLSRNEFVMTADAVRGMGDGDVNAGAQRMYDLMNNLEAKA